MTTTKVLATGIGGAIGSDFRRNLNRLVFVEFSGMISRIDLLRSLAAPAFSGVVTMPADSSLDLTNGTSAQGGHIRWDHTSPGGHAVMRPQGNCDLAYLGLVNYNALTQAELQAITTYSRSTDLNGEPGPGNQLVNGAVFVVRNDSVQPAANFDYAKVQVVAYGVNIQVRWTTYRLSPAYQVLGTGYTNPEDIAVRTNERTAYVTERSGNFLKVDLTSANRAAATVLTPGLTAPHQIALDESRNQAYVVEFANPGRLLRIDLATGTATTVVGGLQNAIGLLVTSDLTYAYVSEQATGGGRIRRVTLGTGHIEAIVSGLVAPFMLTWTDDSQTSFYVTQRDPVNKITLIDLRGSPAGVTDVATGVAFRPSSVAVVSPDTPLVCCNDQVDELFLSPYVITGPMLLGVGLVPVDRISRSSPVNPATDGYADTTVDPLYFFQVKDTPFGGTLALMFNHQGAFGAGARFYRLAVDGVEPRQSFSDYQWNSASNAFVLRTIVPSPAGYYPVRTPGELWYNAWLGYLFDTSSLTNGLHTITVRLFASMLAGSEIGSAANPGRSMVVQIDNSWPSAVINQIVHDGSVVGTCAIVDAGSDQFTFNITAIDPEQNLLSWSLVALWGDNQSGMVAQDSYSSHVSPTRKWAGVNGVVPSPPWHATVVGDPTSRRCAHTFRLSVWDRVINGYGYLHYAEFDKSITLMLP